MNAPRVDHKPRVTAALVASGVLVVGAFAIGLWAVAHFNSTPKSLSALGTFLGGTAGPLLAMASWLFLYTAFKGQQEQLVLQESQLNSQQALMTAQTDVLRQQAFEGGFFSFVRLHRDSVIEQMASPAGPGAPAKQGPHAFAAAAEEFLIRAPAQVKNGGLSEADAAKLVEDICRASHSNFGHYFRTLYYLIEYTMDNAGPGTRTYMKWIRAQLSNNELILLFFNGLSIDGRKTFKARIEKYGLLKGLRLPPSLDALKTLYDGTAFKDPA